MEMTLAPIVLFVYNRPTHTQKTLEALGANRLASVSDLIVFSDGYKNDDDDKINVELTRKIFENSLPFKSVTINKAPKNRGLAKSIIEGVTEVLAKHPTVIVLEDDLITSPSFLEYMNHALSFYNQSHVYSISGYTPPVDIPSNYGYSTYSTGRICSWGWATWRDKWQQVKWSVDDFESFFKDSKEVSRFNAMGDDLSPMLLKFKQEVISSWAIRFAYHTFKSGGIAIYPTKSLVANLGVDGSGTHMKATRKYHVVLATSIDNELFCSPFEANIQIIREFRRFYNTSRFRYAINLVKRWTYLILK